MSQVVFCPSCKSEIAIGDKFCRSCGTHLTWSVTKEEELRASQSAQPKSSTDTEKIICQLCGHENPSGSLFCEACGNSIASKEQIKASAGKAKEGTVEKEKASSLKRFQSWKLTAVLGVIFILVIIILQLQEDTTQQPAQQRVQRPVQQPIELPEETKQQLQAMEQAVRDKPDDKQTVLKFANALYDTRQFVQASTMYQRYLALEPADVNARVDLGVTYFELSRLDSIKHHEYLTLAEKEMKEALNYNPSHQFATFNLGIVYLHVGKMEEASEWFKKCIAIDSTSETGRKAQMLIQQHTFNNP